MTRLVVSASVALLVAALAQIALAEGATPSAAHAHDHAPADQKAGGHAHAHAHEHGVAALDVDLAGGLVTVALTMPGGEFFGDLPDDQRGPAAATAIAARLRPIAPFPDAAGCRVVTSSVEVREITEGEHAGHADVELRLGHVCAAREAISTLAPTVFEQFPKIEKVVLTVGGPGFTLRADLGGRTGPVRVRPFDAPGS